ncbi:MAG: plasmid pRiA4b ORF-3 family protein [Spirochaetales bacterium]|jgi:hypothetical protein|nr:plasmid pRiA4b ORF-3 family protein [Spirochaetales bacterium]
MKQAAKAARPKGPNSIFVFKISIKGIRPQIWRSVQVPGDFSLADFHHVIQRAMGWYNAHLHSFTIEKETYSDDLSNDRSGFGEDAEDESVTLERLGLEAKQRFLYTYDFGDNWDHQILVSKILPAQQCSQEDRLYPLCLKGERACPPEDCGGVYGYDEVMEALKNPEAESSADWTEWLGTYDPEFFDIDAVNKRLREEPAG